MTGETCRIAEKLAELLDHYGQSSDGTWRDRKALLVQAINDQGGSGAGEVLGWFDANTSEID